MAISMAGPLMPVPTAFAEGEPIATTQQGTGKIRINVMSLKRTEGDTMTFRYTVINDNEERVPDLSVRGDLIEIFDFVNRRKYSTSVAATSNCDVPSQSQKLCWSVFGAPKGNPKTLSVKFVAFISKEGRTAQEDFDIVSVPFSSD